MGPERARAADSPAARRLCAVAVLFLGALCVVGGYLLCRMSQNDVKRRGEIVSFNLTIAAENLYKKARRISPKAVHHNDQEKVTAKLLKIFNCTLAECGAIANYNIAEFQFLAPEDYSTDCSRVADNKGPGRVELAVPIQ